KDLPSHPELPDPLTMFDGTPVKTKEQWFEQRRPELKKLFQHYMYGYAPEPPKISAQVTKTDPAAFDGKATLKEVEIRFTELPENAPRIHLVLFVPNRKKGPFPVFLGLNDLGNQVVAPVSSLTIDSSVELDERLKKANAAARGSQTDFWRVENSLDRGYAFATFYQGDIDHDKNDFTDGIHPFYPNLPGPQEARWGTIAAWAWGLQRGVDYLSTDTDIDKTKICLIGHSRRGKTALLAAAFDERVAIAVPHQSGTGGCALSRNNNQETVERINRVFPHWFNDIFPQFNNNEDKLPFDQHLLMALIAPRALMDTAGLQDEWANYENALKSLKAADKVYKFLGCQGLVGNGVIEGDAPIATDNVGEILQYRRDEKHTLNLGYWDKILDFADVYFQKREKTK
ncbi:MAG: acetylxylan esterase, partial [Candidatus Omnitrophota bacterium]